MPYKPSQCRAFGARAGRGQSVPKDWKEHCKGKKQKRTTRTKKKGA